MINWTDGSCYMGEWYYDEIKGKGIFISPLRDVYKGKICTCMCCLCNVVFLHNI